MRPADPARQSVEGTAAGGHAPEPLLLIELDLQGCCTGAWAGDPAVRGEAGTGWPPGPGDALQNCLPPTLAQAAAQSLQDLAAQREALVALVPHGPPGTDGLIELHAMPRRNAAGETTGFTLAVRDASAGAARRRTLGRLAQVARRTSNLVVVTDARRRIEWVNDAFTQATGYTLDEVRGHNPGQLLQYEGTDPDTVARIRRALDAGEPVQAEILNRGKIGREYWLALDIQPILDGRGRLDGFVAVQSDITEDRRRTRRLTQLAQEAEQARTTLAAAVGALPEGFALFGADERLVMCNARYRELHPAAADVLRPGQALETLLRTEAERGAYAQARGREQAWLDDTLEAIRSERGWAAELELADGRWVRSLKRRVPDAGVIALRTEISELKRAEKLAVAQRLAAMDASQDGIGLSDGEGRLLYANAALARMFGDDPQADLGGRHWTGLAASAERDLLAAQARSSLQATGRWRGPVHTSRTDGSSLDLEVSLTRTPEDTLVLVSRDVSERLRLEGERERLREMVVLERVEHAARLERALVETKRLQERDQQMRESSELLVDALRSLGGSEDPADGPRHLLGQLAGAMGTHCAALLAPGAEDGILCLEHPQWWQVIGMQPALMDYLMRRPQRLVADPSAVTALQPLVDTWPAGPLRWVAAARLGPERTARLLVVAGQTAQGLDMRRGQMFERFVPLLAEALRRRDDAVRARRLEQDLQQARKMESLGTLAGGIAHEINTPMQYISDNLHFLKDAFDTLVAALAPAAGRPADDPELAYVLSEIPPALAQSLAGSRRVAEIVEAVRTFAYPELTQDEPVHLRGVLEHSLVITRSVWKHDVQVQLEADPAVPSLRGSPGPLSQVFVNLITNACDAARMVIGGAQGAGGLVRIALLAAPGEVVVHVDDNGPGVPPALRDRIFDPFFTTKRLGEGTGQGLGISRSIVERHGGRLFLEDGPLGGARFTVRFPL